MQRLEVSYMEAEQRGEDGSKIHRISNAKSGSLDLGNRISSFLLL